MITTSEVGIPGPVARRFQLTQTRDEHVGPVRAAVPVELVIGADVGWVAVDMWRTGRVLGLDRLGDPIIWGDGQPVVMSLPWDRIWTLQWDRRG